MIYMVYKNQRKKTSTQQRPCAWRKINIEFHRIYGVQTIRYRIAGRYCHLVNWIIFRLELLNGRIKYWIIEWFNYILYLWKWWILCWIKWFRHCCYSWKSDFIVFNRRHPICYSEKIVVMSFLHNSHSRLWVQTVPSTCGKGCSVSSRYTSP